MNRKKTISKRGLFIYHPLLPTSNNFANLLFFKPWILTPEKGGPSCLNWGHGGVRWFGQCPKENVFFQWILPHQWVTFTPKIRVLAQKMGLWERARVRFFQKIRLRVGVSEIEKTKKRQSHRISAKVLTLNAPPMSDIHTKNQRPSSKMGSWERACVRFFHACLSIGVVRNRKNVEKAKSSDLRQNFDS